MIKGSAGYRKDTCGKATTSDPIRSPWVYVKAKGYNKSLNEGEHCGHLASQLEFFFPAQP